MIVSPRNKERIKEVNTITLYQGDCLEIMSEIADQSVDAIIADLPYGTTQCRWDAVIPFAPMWEHFRRLLKPRGAVALFGSQPFTTDLINSNREWFKYCWVWEKNNSAGFALVKHRPFLITEDICVFSDGGHNYYPQMETRGKPRRKDGYTKSECYGGLQPSKTGRKSNTYYPKNVLRYGNANQNDKMHPTQKPLELLEYLVKTYTNPGDTVLDCVMGSGTTGHACVNLDRRFIGIELEQRYFEIAMNRIELAQREPRQLELL